MFSWLTICISLRHHNSIFISWRRISSPKWTLFIYTNTWFRSHSWSMLNWNILISTSNIIISVWRWSILNIYQSIASLIESLWFLVLLLLLLLQSTSSSIIISYTCFNWILSSCFIRLTIFWFLIDEINRFGLNLLFFHISHLNYLFSCQTRWLWVCYFTN